MRTLFCTLALLVVVPALADDAPRNGGCVEVEVNGYKALSYECLTERLANPEGEEAARRNAAMQRSPLERSAPGQMGLATPAATSVRMGNQFGQSVHPQRP